MQDISTPGRREAFDAFLKIGMLSFGGPAAQISLMHRILVDEKGWLTEKQYLNALSFCMLLPGPEAMQLATYAGWRCFGITGGLIAGLLFVIPGALVIFALAFIYAMFGDVPLVATLFLGVKAAVLIIVLEALLRVSKRALKGQAHWIIAGCAFIAIFFLSLPYPLIILVAALYGGILGQNHEADGHSQAIETSLSKTLVTIAIGVLIWLVPVLLLYVVTGGSILADIGIFFSKLAVVTFGGAYAVLAYMSQDVVTGFGWLSAGEMMDGLGLAETTPGPLILVTQFVGFLAAFREGGYGLAFVGASITLWVTFVPCFLWIFAGAPYIEWISAQPRLSGALSAITAAVVGVILNLSLWFSLHVLFEQVTAEHYGLVTVWMPEFASLNWHAAVLAIICGILLLRVHLGIGWVLSISTILGWALVTFA